MKIVRQYGPRDVRVEETDEPEPGPQELKIKVRSLSPLGPRSMFVFSGLYDSGQSVRINWVFTGSMVSA